ncbi:MULTISPECIES: ABC transporter substrate-binding protein [Actinomyces]|uniref:ABC transporter substrate-binding protein n=1 Tax=Actinomyces TaxID=1654 RepID=UPI00109D82B4|nr:MULTISPECIES: ABC transporter substrate-binding protein [Actinomyces]
MRSVNRRLRRAVAFASALVLATTGVAACSSGGGQSAEGDVDCAKYEQWGDLSGETINIYSPYVGADQERLENSWAGFSQCTGAEIVYEGSTDFESQIQVRIQGGNAPDIAFIPQPALLNTLAQQDVLIPASDAVAASVEAGWSESFSDYATVDGTLYGSPLTTGVKSYVWYSVPLFEAGGYEAPTTWQELLDLTARIQADTGQRVWCDGFESGAATGWPGTDWLEDLVLRTAGEDVYDQWIAHEIPFDDPQIVAALDEVGKILKNADYVNAGFGDVTSIASTNQIDALTAVTDGESCYMSHRTASATFDEDVTVAPDGDVWGFYLPGTSADDPKQLVGGGEFTVAFTESDAVESVRQYLASDTWANDIVTQGMVSANTGVDASNAPTPQLENAIELLQSDGAVFRFDASDLMPTAVGGGTFWKGMTDWVLGSTTAQVLSDIESGWND